MLRLASFALTVTLLVGCADYTIDAGMSSQEAGSAGVGQQGGGVVAVNDTKQDLDIMLIFPGESADDTFAAVAARVAEGARSLSDLGETGIEFTLPSGEEKTVSPRGAECVLVIGSGKDWVISIKAIPREAKKWVFRDGASQDVPWVIDVEEKGNIDSHD